MSLLTPKERLHLPAWDNPAESRFPRVEIDRTACDGCELCALVCPADVLEIIDRKAQVKADNRGCVGCNNCQAICKRRAIEARVPFDFDGYYRQLGIGDFSPPRRF